jgi:hypothetical protein
MKIKMLIVGGTFSQLSGEIKKSGVISKIQSQLSSNNDVLVNCLNGGFVSSLDNLEVEKYDLVLWMPNIDNSYVKKYPKKGLKSIMIVSKSDRGDGSDISAINRIFNMRGNAVILVSKSEHHVSSYSFKLIDALGNTWYNGDDIQHLCCVILQFYNWNSGMIRKSIEPNTNLNRLVCLTSIVADKFELCYSRFFGNCSTRCGKMFPSTRFFFSKRNTNKMRLTIEDMIYVDEKSGYVCSDNKPSVDTPVQIEIYKEKPEINFMIHGHSYIKKAPFTEKYFPCGDLREVDEVLKLIHSNHGYINLLNHGFIIYADTIDNLEKLVLNCELINRMDVEIKEV